MRKAAALFVLLAACAAPDPKVKPAAPDPKVKLGLPFLHRPWGVFISGKAFPGARVEVNGLAADVNPKGSFVARVFLDHPGNHEVVAVAWDPVTNQRHETRSTIKFPDLEAEFDRDEGVVADPATTTYGEVKATDDQCCRCPDREIQTPRLSQEEQ